MNQQGRVIGSRSHPAPSQFHSPATKLDLHVTHAGHTNGKVGKIDKYQLPLPLGLESQSAGACEFAYDIRGGGDKSQPPP